MALDALINEWVEKQFENVSCSDVKDKKVIRDALLNTNRFQEYEINILDLPIVQRLRRIAQTGFTYLTYPSSTHNRFEHTLGVTVLASKFINALKDKEKGIWKEEYESEVRLAGILHDIGHGPFSHISENIYKNFPDVNHELKTNQKFSKNKTKPHEMLSYLIITSNCFQDFFQDELCSKKYCPPINLQNVANMIVGDMDDPSMAFLSDIINGAFDADKLDYIPRDCYFTGLKMNLDIDRIMYTISIDQEKMPNNRKGLLIDISGAPFIEQILFNKMMLFTSLYHHHKVRTLECMFYSIFEACNDFNLSFNGFSFNKVTDFLSIDDIDVLSLEGKPDEIKPFIENIRNRDLLKRALVISKSTLQKPKGTSEKGGDEIVEMNYQKLLELMEDPKSIRKLREIIAEESGENINPYDVWIDIPNAPSFREPSNTLIRINKEDIRTLDKIFPIDQWLNSYAENKWKAHVFCPPQYRKKIEKVVRDVFKERKELGIEFNKYATIISDDA